MSSSVTTTTNGVVVNTHVNPYGNGMGVAGVASTPHCLGQTVSSVMGDFRAGHPKALGTVPIMIGLMMLLKGIVMATAAWLDNIGVVSGIFVWGSIIQVSIIGNQILVPDGRYGSILTPSNAPFPPQNNYETVNYPMGPEGAGMGTGFQQNHLLPQYTA